MLKETYLGKIIRRLTSGIPGLLLLGCRVSLKCCWREFFSLLGGSFGPFATGLSLMTLPRSAHCCLTILFRSLLIGVLIVVLVLFLRSLSWKTLMWFPCNVSSALLVFYKSCRSKKKKKSSECCFEFIQAYIGYTSLLILKFFQF